MTSNRAGLLLAAASLLATCALHASGTDAWDRFRGPNGLGTVDSKALPTKIGPDEKTVWTISTPPGQSSPVLDAERLYLTGHEGDSLLTLAFDRKSGKELWRAQAPRPRLEKLDNRNGPAGASPVTDGEIVVVFFGDFGLIAYDRDGKELWQRPLGPFNNLYGMGSSPVLLGDRVLYAADQSTGSYLIAVDKKTGKELWRTERPEARTGHSTPSIYTPAGGSPQILQPGSFFLTAFSPETGEKIWWVRGLSFEMKSVPVIVGDTAYINGFGSEFNEPGVRETIHPWSDAIKGDKNGNGALEKDEVTGELAQNWFPFNDLNGSGALEEEEWTYFSNALESRNNIMAVRLPSQDESGDLSRTHVRWQYYRSIPQLPSAIVMDDVLLMVNDRGIVTTFRAGSGEVIEQGRIDGFHDSVYSSPVGGDGKIYLAGRSGKFAVLPADGSIEPLFVSDFEDQMTATPAISGGTIYVRTKSKLFAFQN